MENPAEYVVIGWKMMLALVGGSGLIGVGGVWLLARFTSTFDAYAGERAKIEAQTRAIEKLVANTEKLTVATETIKAKVTDETWDRQQRWSYKQAMYRELIETLIALQHAAFGVNVMEAKSDPALATYRSEFLSCLKRMNAVSMVATVCVSPDAFTILQRLSTNPHTLSDTHSLADSIQGVITALVGEARTDLGYSPFTPVSTSILGGQL